MYITKIQGGAVNHGLNIFFQCIPLLAGVIPQRWTDVVLPVEKSSEFKLGEYSSQSAETRIPPRPLMRSPANSSLANPLKPEFRHGS
jgi:hypothetical protein